MNLELKPFQAELSEQILEELRLAKAEIGSTNKAEAIILSAPTGSGKTIIATDVVEKVLSGYDDHQPDAAAVFLWLTDQPELNEQTRRKMLAASTILGPSRLVTVESSFDEETFPAGKVYFLNTQKLGRDKNLVEAGDKRTYTIWQTVTNTVRRDPAKFLLIIDEAHRGMSTSAADRAQAETIVQKFVKGSPNELPAVPLVLGISATPDRFHRALAGTARVIRPIEARPEDVRESGLIKDFVRFRVPKDSAPSDITLLRNAVERWLSYKEAWREYCASEGLQTLDPLLIVQVEDADSNRITRTDLAEVMSAIEDVAGPLSASAYAHAFQEGVVVPVGTTRAIRYLAPSDVSDDSTVQVVFFKTSLSTGWDCPRAEVMMSFRRAKDATLIAQLVGRMVRTPLARRIEKNEMLNSVTLMLPHYDATELHKVVERLKAADPEGMPPTQFTDDDNVEDLHRATTASDCFSAAAQVPSYVLQGRRRMSETRRLMKLARLLVRDDIVAGAVDRARALVLDVIDAEYALARDSDAFKRVVARMSGVDIEERTYTLGQDISALPDLYWTASSEQNIEDRFAELGRRIGEGLHKTYWRHHLGESADARRAKCETMALLLRDGLLERVLSDAKTVTDTWLRQFRLQIARLPERSRQAYAEILGSSSEPSESVLDLPLVIQALNPPRVTTWDKHIYINARGAFGTDLNSWETAVILDEIARLDVIGWYRNPPRKSYSLCVPYENADGNAAGLYPDFVVFRQTEHGVVLDIVDPHLVDLDDAFRKANGLAKYVDRHPNAFGRVIVARIHDGVIQRLDLAEERVRREVRTLSTNDHLRSLYNTLSL